MNLLSWAIIPVQVHTDNSSPEHCGIFRGCACSVLMDYLLVKHTLFYKLLVSIWIFFRIPIRFFCFEVILTEILYNAMWFNNKLRGTTLVKTSQNLFILLFFDGICYVALLQILKKFIIFQYL